MPEHSKQWRCIDLGAVANPADRRSLCNACLV